MVEERYHLYKKYRSKTYNYIDESVRSYFEMGGTLIHIYPLLGVVKSDGSVIDITSTNESTVSDVVLNENNKRKYSHTTYDMYVTLTLNPPSYSFTFSGINIIDGDVLEMCLHYNMMVETLGRKIIPGDVLECSFMRDLDVLGKDRAQNKFYVVTDSMRDENGWDPSSQYHLWKIKCKPVMNSPEFEDLFNLDKDPDGTPNPQGGDDGFYVPPGDPNGGGGLDPDATQDDKLDDQVDDILDEADGDDGTPENGWNATGVSYRLWDEHQAFLLINGKYYKDDGEPNIVGIDGIPAEKNCDEVPFGSEFPKNSKEGDYFVRTDFNNPRLYKRVYDKTTYNTADIYYGDDIRINNAIVTLIGKNYDGSIKDSDNKLIGNIDKDRVYINGQYIGYVTESGKIVANSGLIIGEIKSKDIIHKKKWVLVEIDMRERWHGSPQMARYAINNVDKFINEEGEIEESRQNMKTIANRRVKKEHWKPRPWNKPLQKEIAEETGIEHRIIDQIKPH